MWSKLKEQFNLLKLEKKRLYLITNSDQFESKEIFLDAIASALQGGTDIIQLREKDIPDRILVDLGHKLRVLCDEYGATFIMNDRLDLAMITEADGVHLGRNDISINDAREVLGANAIIGKTACTKEEIISAINCGADYISIGPVTPETSKMIGIDMDLVVWANKYSKVPIFVFGEIDENFIMELTREGVKRVVTSENLMYAKSPEQTARSMLSLLPYIN